MELHWRDDAHGCSTQRPSIQGASNSNLARSSGGLRAVVRNCTRVVQRMIDLNARAFAKEQRSQECIVANSGNVQRLATRGQYGYWRNKVANAHTMWIRLDCALNVNVGNILVNHTAAVRNLADVTGWLLYDGYREWRTTRHLHRHLEGA
jgi:hypothetical protein